MPIKEPLESSSGYVEDVVGTFLGSFVVVIVMIFACVACRRKQSKDRRIYTLFRSLPNGAFQSPTTSSITFTYITILTVFPNQLTLREENGGAPEENPRFSAEH
jgi:hypothetical protein